MYLAGRNSIIVGIINKEVRILCFNTNHGLSVFFDPTFNRWMCPRCEFRLDPEDVGNYVQSYLEV